MGYVKGNDGIARTVKNPLEGSIGDIDLDDIKSNTVSATGNVTGGNISSTGNIFFSNGSKLTSASWTLVETINGDLTFGDVVVPTTQSFNYYSSLFNEVLYACGAGGDNGTIVIPVTALTAGSTWNVNGHVGIKWANLANANITLVDLTNPLTTVTVTMYAR
jgi:hypothetical protein